MTSSPGPPPSRTVTFPASGNDTSSDESARHSRSSRSVAPSIEDPPPRGVSRRRGSRLVVVINDMGISADGTPTSHPSPATRSPCDSRSNRRRNCLGESARAVRMRCIPGSSTIVGSAVGSAGSRAPMNTRAWEVRRARMFTRNWSSVTRSYMSHASACQAVSRAGDADLPRPTWVRWLTRALVIRCAAATRDPSGSGVCAWMVSVVRSSLPAWGMIVRVMAFPPPRRRRRLGLGGRRGAQRGARPLRSTPARS